MCCLQAVSDAEAAHDNAMDTRDAVATTLQKVSDLLNMIGESCRSDVLSVCFFLTSVRPTL
jgi:enamine deaminase RidA (YjgF/YER057c/UK114 family)